MIYVCIPSHNEAATIGLLLWKIRQVFAGFPREYQLLVLDDGSTDATSEILEPYARVLPLMLVQRAERQGYAASVQELFRTAIDLTDRPKRDAAILMHADFSHNPQIIPDLVRRIESGADLVVAEATLEGEPSRSHRMLRRMAATLLKGTVTVPGVRDITSGFAIVRLVALRNAMRSHGDEFLVSDGWAANAELYWRTGRYARRVESVPFVERHDLRQRPSRLKPTEEAMNLWRARSKFRATPIAPQAESARDAERHAETVS